MTVLLAHPTPIIGDGLRGGLQARLGVEVILVDTLPNLLGGAVSPEVRIALVDEALVKDEATELCDQLLVHGVPMVLMTARQEGLLDVLACGVRGVVDLRNGLDGVVNAVQAVQEGLTHLPSHLLSTVLLEVIVARRAEAGADQALAAAPVRTLHTTPSSRPTAGAGLSGREVEVLELLCAGADQSDIARSLTIATSTAKTHIARIMAKLGARTRAEAVQIAMRSGLIAVEEKRA